MKSNFMPKIEKPTVGFNENICVATVPCPVTGETLDLNMAILSSAYGKLSSNKGARLPAVIWLAGGGWLRCDPNEMVAETVYLAENGYAVFFPKYRRSLDAPFPACIADVQTAIRYIRANAETLGIDPKRIGIMGRSAGGHLAALSAMNYKEYVGEWMGNDFRVQAAVDLYGPTDMHDMQDLTIEKIKNSKDTMNSMKPQDSPEYKLMSCPQEENPELWREASPAQLVTEAMCPMLIFHGTEDALVDISQSQKLYKAIEDLGRTDCDFYTIDGFGHGGECFFQPDTRKIILKFFDKHLK